MAPTLAPEQIVEAATMLTQARRRGERLEGLGECTPTTAADAESISDEHAERLGRRVVGWKIGCTSQRAMEILGSPGPFAGRIFADTVFESGEVPFADFVSPQIETEFAFILGEDLPARTEPWTIGEVRQATQAVAPAFEIVAPRMTDFVGVGYLTLIADSGANGGVVLGDPLPLAELPLLAGVRVSLAIDGAEQTIGGGADILGDPWNALRWLADHLSGRGLDLHAGQVVMSGTCTGVWTLGRGQVAAARFHDLGDVTLAFT